LFLDGHHLLLRLKLGCNHLLVFAQAGFHHIPYRTLLLVALGDSGIHILVSQVILHFADKLSDIAVPRSLGDGQETLDNESDHSQKSAYQDRYNDTTIVHTGETTLRTFLIGPESTVKIGFSKIRVRTDKKSPDQITGNDTHQRGDPGDRITLFLRLNGRGALCCCRCSRFCFSHDRLFLVFLKKLKYVIEKLTMSFGRAAVRRLQRSTILIKKAFRRS